MAKDGWAALRSEEAGLLLEEEVLTRKRVVTLV